MSCKQKWHWATLVHAASSLSFLPSYYRNGNVIIWHQEDRVSPLDNGLLGWTQPGCLRVVEQRETNFCLVFLSLRAEPKPAELAALWPQMSNPVSKPVFQFLIRCLTYETTFGDLLLTVFEEEVLLVRIWFEESIRELWSFVPSLIYILAIFQIHLLKF